MIVLTVVAGLVVGVFSALFGVGGGVLMVPFIAVVLERTQHVAEGTSLLAMIPAALAGALAHGDELVRYRPAALVGGAGIVGSLAGARLALEVPSETLQDVFALFLVVVALRLIWKNRPRSSPQEAER